MIIMKKQQWDKISNKIIGKMLDIKCYNTET